jgi:hypothetical protein
LEAGAKAFVNSDRGVRVENEAVKVSSIYDWFKEDFGTTDAAVLDHIRKYAAPVLMAKLEGKSKLGGHDYNWTLNDVPAVKK